MATTAAHTEPPRAQIKRDQIRQAARCLFLQQGFEATSMDAITTAAAVSKRTLYKYYPSKEALLADMVFQISLGSRGPRPVQVDQLAITTATELEDLLVWLASDIVEHHRNPEFLALLRIIIAETPRLPAIAEHYRAAVIDPGYDFLCAIFDRARAAGVVKSPETAAAVRLFMGSILFATYTYGLMGPGPPRGLSREEIRAQVHLLVAAIT